MNFEDSILKIGSKLTMLPSTILFLIGETNNLSVQMDTRMERRSMMYITRSI